MKTEPLVTLINPLKIHVATPCHANWEDMNGDDQARFCRECSKHVYHLSSMSPAAVLKLIQEKEGRFCGRFYQRADGTVLHAEDCPVGLAARQWRKMKSFAGAMASVVLSMVGFSIARADDQAGGTKIPPAAQPPKDGRMIMGDICIPSKPSPTPAPKPSVPPPRE